MRLVALALALLAPAAVTASGNQAPDPAGRFDEAVAAYRAGDHQTASTLWRSLLGAAAASPETLDPATLCYDLGNAAFRMERPLEAAGWYTAALRLRPRDADLWANLELARERARLDPADRGDLLATLERLVTSLTLAEAEWLVLALALALAVALAVDAHRGGRGPRRTVLVTGALLVLATIPWSWRLATAGDDPRFVIAAGGLPLRSEPRAAAVEVGRLEPGATVEGTDEIPGWVRVSTPDGLVGWVEASAVLPLAPTRLRS